MRETEIQHKQLQKIESAVKLFMAWQGRKDVPSGISAFNLQWQSLVAFCSSEPVVRIGCNFIFEVRYKVCAHDILNPALNMASELKLSALQENLSGDSAYMQSLQRRYIALSLASALEADISAADLLGQLGRILCGFLDPSNQSEFPLAILQELRCLETLVDGKIVAASEADFASLEQALRSVPDGVSSAPLAEASALELLRRYPKQGQPILRMAQTRLDAMRESVRLVATAQTSKDSCEELAIRADLSAECLDNVEKIGAWYYNLSDVQTSTLLSMGKHSELKSCVVKLGCAVAFAVVSAWSVDFALHEKSADECVEAWACVAFAGRRGQARRAIGLQCIQRLAGEADELERHLSILAKDLSGLRGQSRVR